MCLGLETQAGAQSTTGTISGVVRDDQAAVIPGATVTVRTVLMGQSRVVVSGDEGQCRFPSLQVGEYELAVELAGFGSYKQAGLNLSLNQDAAIDVMLRPAGVAESVQVTADTPLPPVPQTAWCGLRVAVPDSESLHRRFGHAAGMLPDFEMLSPADRDVGHVRYFNLRSLRALCEDAGYQVVKAEGILLEPVTTGQLEKPQLDPTILQGMLKVGVDYPEPCNSLLLKIQPRAA